MKPNTLRGMAAVIAHVPYQLGFHPHDCVVVIGLSADTIVVTVRLDADAAGIDLGDAHHLVSVLLRTPVDRSIVIGFGDSFDPSAATRQLAQLLDRHAMPAQHQLLVTDASWSAIHCEFGCCPGDEQLPLLQAADVPMIAEEVFRGAAPLPNRDEVVAQLERVHPFLPATVRRSLGRAPRVIRTTAVPPATQIASLALVLVPSATPVGQFEPATIVRACRALQHIELRDCAVAWVGGEDDQWQPMSATLCAFRKHLEPLEWSNATVHPCSRAEVTQRLLDWLSCVPRAWQPPILTLIAMQQWHGNGGVLGTAAAERALEIDANYALAQLIYRALRGGVRPPTRWSAEPA